MSPLRLLRDFKYFLPATQHPFMRSNKEAGDTDGDDIDSQVSASDDG